MPCPESPSSSSTKSSPRSSHGLTTGSTETSSELSDGRILLLPVFLSFVCKLSPWSNRGYSFFSSPILSQSAISSQISIHAFMCPWVSWAGRFCILPASLRGLSLRVRWFWFNEESLRIWFALIKQLSSCMSTTWSSIFIWKCRTIALWYKSDGKTWIEQALEKEVLFRSKTFYTHMIQSLRYKPYFDKTPYLWAWTRPCFSAW